MARWTGTTTERGYNGSHRALRKRLIAQWRPGDPCARCGLPMYGPAAMIDLGHTEDRTGYVGLEHRACNRRDGASRALRAPRAIAAAGSDVRCKTCGQPYHYPGRTCGICGCHYHPSRNVQATCGMRCSLEYRRRKYGGSTTSRKAKPKPPPKPRRAGPVASGEREPKNGWPVLAVAYYTCRYCGTVGVTKANARQQREVCPARSCQLARLASNNLRTRKGLTRQEADAAAAAYVAEGDHRQTRCTPEQIAADRRWSQTVATVRRATERASRAW